MDQVLIGVCSDVMRFSGVCGYFIRDTDQFDHDGYV